MFRVKERVGGSSVGEATRIHCKEREGRERKSVFMEECDCVQCMGDGTD